MLERKAYWSRRIVDLDSSGLSRAEFCRRRGINYQTMSWWVRRLASEEDDVRDRGRSAADHGVLSFVEVPVRADAALTSYEVVLGGGRSIRIAAGFDDDTLTRLIQVVDAC